MQKFLEIIFIILIAREVALSQIPNYNSDERAQNLSTSATDHSPYFDLPGFAEIINNATASNIDETTAQLTDFLTSTSFAFNDRISQSITRNGLLYVEILRDRRINFQIFHPKAGLITDPKFGVDLVPNIHFIRALMKVQSAALREIADSAQKVLNVMAYPDRNASSDAAIIYQHCIMVAAVGINNSNCIKENDIQLSNDTAAIAKFERAYMISYRISRLAFTKFHDEIKILGDVSVVKESIEIQLQIERNPEMMRYSRSAISEEQYQQMTIFKVSQVEDIPECKELRANHKVIKDIFESQLGCTSGKLFGFDTCYRQHSEENRRKVSVPSLGLEFASIFYQSPINEDRDPDYKFIKLKSVCPVDPRYHYVTN